MLPRRRSILRIWNGCGMSISGVDVAHRADVDLAAGEEGHGAVEVDGEAALDAAEDAALDALAFAELALELVPRGFAAGAVAAEHRFAFGVLDAVDEHFDFVADDQAVSPSSSPRANSRRATRPSLLRPTSITAMPFSIAVMVPLTTRPSKPPSRAAELFVEEFREIVARGIGGRCHGVQVPNSRFSGQAVVSAGLSGRPAREPNAARASSTAAGRGGKSGEGGGTARRWPAVR